MAEYYFLTVGEETSHGPLTWEQLQLEVAHLNPANFYFWHEKMAGWEIASESKFYQEIYQSHQPLIGQSQSQQLIESNEEPPPFIEEVSSPEVLQMPLAPTEPTIKTFSAESSLPTTQATDLEVTDSTSSKEGFHFSPYSSEDLQRREHIKLPLKLSIVIKNGHNAFVSSTRNIALSSALLSLPCPATLAGPQSEIFLIDRKKNQGISFRCEVIPHDGSPSLLQFCLKDDIVKANLAKWLDEQVHFMAVSA